MSDTLERSQPSVASYVLNPFYFPNIVKYIVDISSRATLCALYDTSRALRFATEDILHHHVALEKSSTPGWLALRIPGKCPRRWVPLKHARPSALVPGMENAEASEAEHGDTQPSKPTGTFPNGTPIPHFSAHALLPTTSSFDILSSTQYLDLHPGIEELQDLSVLRRIPYLSTVRAHSPPGPEQMWKSESWVERAQRQLTGGTLPVADPGCHPATPVIVPIPASTVVIFRNIRPGLWRDIVVAAGWRRLIINVSISWDAAYDYFGDLSISSNVMQEVVVRFTENLTGSPLQVQGHCHLQHMNWDPPHDGHPASLNGVNYFGVGLAQGLLAAIVRTINATKDRSTGVVKWKLVGLYYQPTTYFGYYRSNIGFEDVKDRIVRAIGAKSRELRLELSATEIRTSVSFVEMKEYEETLDPTQFCLERWPLVAMTPPGREMDVQPDVRKDQWKREVLNQRVY